MYCPVKVFMILSISKVKPCPTAYAMALDMWMIVGEGGERVSTTSQQKEPKGFEIESQHPSNSSNSPNGSADNQQFPISIFSHSLRKK
ncbi:hypothetical protein SADUNF_Sadunf04G0161200 [Salix dunnii]|uniref:Uncharacterized protein n=1 Tax=Salix dunnii TaxID=1413687 RepID=A0A835N436_9ROSI|nr:hypothetical protein SADUNF_Sadunf04G0161200 [Salix dunnii]